MIDLDTVLETADRAERLGLARRAQGLAGLASAEIPAPATSVGPVHRYLTDEVDMAALSGASPAALGRAADGAPSMGALALAAVTSPGEPLEIARALAPGGLSTASGAATGILAGVVASMRSIPVDDDRYPHYFLSECERALMAKWRPTVGEDERVGLDQAHAVLQDMFGAGINLRDHGDLSVVAAWRDEYSRLGLKADDPLWIAALITGSLAWAGSRLELALQVVVRAPGDVACAGHAFGTFTGAWAGRKTV